MSTTILAPIVLCVLGIIFGIILAVASKVFAVEKDPREELADEYRDVIGFTGAVRRWAMVFEEPTVAG